MEVSIIIINFNTFKLTYNCIQSVIVHTFGITYEIILIDNASKECNADLFKEQFPQIKLIKSEQNLGFAGGNNLGLNHASGEYILLLNSDTVMVENSIQFIYKKCKTIRDLGAATIKLTYPDGEIQHSAQKFPSLVAHFLFTTRLNKVFRKLYQKKGGVFDFSTNFSCDWIWGTFFFFPAKNLNSTNGKLADTYFMYAEDKEWCHYFKNKGLKNYYFNETKIIHLGGMSSPDKFKNKLIIQNNLHFIKKHYGVIHYSIEKLLISIDAFESKLRPGRKGKQSFKNPELKAKNQMKCAQ